jgi:hypothetical protein
MGCAFSAMLIYLHKFTFKRMQNDLKDDTWDFVEKDNVQFKLSKSQVYNKCISCISSLRWHILEEKNITHSGISFDRIIGFTNFGITIIPEIFIIDISEVKKYNTTAICSVRPSSLPFGGSVKRSKKRLKKLTICLSPDLFNLHTLEPAPSRFSY